MAYQFGDVLLVPITFTDATAGTKRPVLVPYDSVDADLLVAPVTSHPPRNAHDVILRHWVKAGLRLPSTVRASKLATVAKSTVTRKMGNLSDSDATVTRDVVREFFARVV